MPYVLGSVGVSFWKNPLGSLIESSVSVGCVEIYGSFGTNKKMSE
jgi:hypothetical protein